MVPTRNLTCIEIHVSECVFCFHFQDKQSRKTCNTTRGIEGLQIKRLPQQPTILRLLLIAPVTSATVECSNSSLRFVKNAYRSTMREERLSALLPLFIHKDIGLD